MPAPEGRPPSRGRLALLTCSILLFTTFLALLATGGFQTSVFGVRVSARSPGPAAALGALALVAWAVGARRARAIADDLAHASAWIETHARAIAAAIAAVAGASVVLFGTFSAAGADASGYLSQAVVLSRGGLTYDEPLAGTAGWPEAATTLAPLGWRAAAGTTQVPTYAVGLPLLMAWPHALGGAIGASLVVSASAALAVWFAARLAQLLGGGAAGVLAAAWLATMPVFLFEAIQPMSDVPVTAAWLAVWWFCARAAAAPAAVALCVAVLIRPNLAPLAVVPVLYAAVAGRVVASLGLKPRARDSPPAWAHGLKPAASLLVGAAVAAAVVAYLQWHHFGSPWRSGYGSAAEIYSLATVVPNTALYLRWLLDTHGPWLLAAPLLLFVRRDALAGFLLGFAALVCAAYLIYAIFEHWSYLRFMLPAMAIAATAASASAAVLARRVSRRAGAVIVAAITLALAAWQVSGARDLGVFRFAARQSRALLAGHYLASALPAHAVVIAGEQSGAVRYYSGRPIVRWDFLAPVDLPLVINDLTARGQEVWIALDDWEVPRYREKFPRSIAAGLDWPPAVDAGTEARTQAWRLRDRARFMIGERTPTDRLR